MLADHPDQRRSGPVEQRSYRAGPSRRRNIGAGPGRQSDGRDGTIAGRGSRPRRARHQISRGPPPYLARHERPESDGRALYDIVLKNGYKQALEIGTSTGLSGIHTAWRWPRPRETHHRRDRRGATSRSDGQLQRSWAGVLHRRATGRRPRPGAEARGALRLRLHRRDKEWYVNYAKAVLPKLKAGGCIAAHNVSAGGAGGGRWAGTTTRSSPVSRTWRHCRQWAAGDQLQEVESRQNTEHRIRNTGRGRSSRTPIVLRMLPPQLTRQRPPHRGPSAPTSPSRPDPAPTFRSPRSSNLLVTYVAVTHIMAGHHDRLESLLREHLPSSASSPRVNRTSSTN